MIDVTGNCVVSWQVCEGGLRLILVAPDAEVQRDSGPIERRESISLPAVLECLHCCLWTVGKTQVAHRCGGSSPQSTTKQLICTTAGSTVASNYSDSDSTVRAEDYGMVLVFSSRLLLTVPRRIAQRSPLRLQLHRNFVVWQHKMAARSSDKASVLTWWHVCKRLNANWIALIRENESVSVRSSTYSPSHVSPLSTTGAHMHSG